MKKDQFDNFYTDISVTLKCHPVIVKNYRDEDHTDEGVVSELTFISNQEILGKLYEFKIREIYDVRKDAIEIQFRDESILDLKVMRKNHPILEIEVYHVERELKESFIIFINQVMDRLKKEVHWTVLGPK